MTTDQNKQTKSQQLLSNSRQYIIPTIILSSILILASEAFATTTTGAASIDIVGGAADEVKKLITGKGRQVIDAGMVGGGAFISLMKSSWVPIVSSGVGVAIFEILIAAVGK